jgi:phage baseplate assembly protein W
MRTLYRGFSTYNRFKKFRVTDYELVKQNLINHFNIRKGEKLMNPNFGTIIWNTLFEPLTDEVRKIITDDVKKIAAYDPRGSIDNITITEKDFGIQIELDLTYSGDNQSSTLVLNFDRDSQTISKGTI